MEYNIRKIFLERLYTKFDTKTSPRLFLKKSKFTKPLV